MRIISHRGNLNGSNPLIENLPSQIDLVLNKGFDCEIDLWEVDGLFYLGHDKPQHKISFTDLLEWKRNIWIHCKNKEALVWMSRDEYFNYFWHENDKFTITGNQFIWAYPSKEVFKEAVNVMPEINNLTKEDLKDCFAICTDYPLRYK